MTKEIKSFLVQIKGNDEWKEIYDYITNLQQENVYLTNELNKSMIERNNYLSRVEKAVEYIKEDMYVEPKELYGLVDGEHLLNILQGEDNDN